MRAPLFAAATAALACAPATASAQSTIFASPPISVGYGGAANATCYFSNLGGATVRVRNARIYSAGGDLSLTGNNCGDPANFTLAPLSSCYIGAGTEGGRTLGCASLVNMPNAMRGTVEIRQSDGTVLERAALGVGSGTTSADRFQRFASAVAYGSPQQRTVACRIFNLGGTAVRLKARQILTSTGADVPIVGDSCGSRAEATLAAGANCNFYAFARDPLTDRQCRVLATRKPNLRGAMSFSATLAVYSSTPME